VHIAKGLVKIALGLSLMAGGIAAQMAWLAFCFGTVIVGILLAFVSPFTLIAPFTFLWFPGWALIKSGGRDIDDPNRNLPDHIIDRASAISSIVAPQLHAISQRFGHCAIDVTTLAYVAAQVAGATMRVPSLVDTRDILGYLLIRDNLYEENADALKVAYQTAKQDKRNFFSEVSSLEFDSALDVFSRNFLLDR
jgi:hypothetical protein